jgi:predicted membrane protein
LKRRRQGPSGLRRLMEVVIGAFVGFLIAYYALAFCLGSRRFQEEVIQGFHLPRLPFIASPTEPPAKSPAGEP